MKPDKPRRLGRGLEALLGAGAPASPATIADAKERGELQRIRLGDIRPNPYQPRRTFDEAELSDLEASLRENGLLQPITVRPADNAKGFELVAGERRLRAATRLGWTDIPALVRKLDDKALLTLALVENLQRADLDPLEEAEGYQRLIDEFDLTQQQVADVVGKDRSTVANMLRLLGLPASVRRLVQESKITLGHARALLALGDEQAMTDLARRIVAEGLTVRDVERRAREGSSEKRPIRERVAKPEGTAITRRIEDDLRRHLQTDVRISLTEGDRGTISISFYSADDLERVLDLVLGPKREQL
jgi:ParB family transcriptional regulator, chromosome partitioning protein